MLRVPIYKGGHTLLHNGECVFFRDLFCPVLAQWNPEGGKKGDSHGNPKDSYMVVSASFATHNKEGGKDAVALYVKQREDGCHTSARNSLWACIAYHIYHVSVGGRAHTWPLKDKWGPERRTDGGRVAAALHLIHRHRNRIIDFFVGSQQLPFSPLPFEEGAEAARLH